MFAFARAVVYEISNVYAVKMAGVFMFVTCTVALRTRFLARWIAYLGYALALMLVLKLDIRELSGVCWCFRSGCC